MKKIFYIIFAVSFVVILGEAYYVFVYKNKSPENLPQELDKTANLSTNPRKIHILSQSSYYDVSLQDSALLENELNKLDFWQKDKIGINNSNKIIWVTAKSLEIVFVDDTQPWGGIFSKEKNKSISSFNVEADKDGNITLKIWVDGSYLEDITSFKSLVLRTLFDSLFISTNWDSFQADSSQHLSYLNGLIDKIDSSEFSSLLEITPK